MNGKNKQSMRKDQSDSSSSFHYIEDDDHDFYGKRTGQYLGTVDVKNRMDKLANWKDFAPDDSEEFTYSIQYDQEGDLEKTAQFEDRTYPPKIDKIDRDNQEEKSAKKNVNKINNDNAQELNEKLQINDKRQSKIIKNIEANIKDRQNVKQKQVLQADIQSPFSVNGISQIKKNIVISSDNTKSEIAFLQLLNFDESAQKQKSIQKQQQKKMDDVKNKAEQKNRESGRQNLKQLKYSQLSDCEQFEKVKKLLINEQGKLKQTNDSLTKLDENQQDTKQQYKRKKQHKDDRELFQDQSEGEYIGQHEPMDIVYDQQLQKKEEKNIKTKQENNKRRKKKIIRVVEQDQENQTKKQENPTKKQKITTNKHKDQNKRINHQNFHQSKHYKKTIDKQQSGFERPKRFRTNTLKYWINQKAIYSKQGLILGISNICNQQFLKLLGIVQPQKIGNHSIVHFSKNEIKLQIYLNANQKVTSNRLNYDQSQLRERIRNLQQYDKLIIYSDKQKQWSTSKLSITVDEQNNKSLPVQIRREQSFQIKNKNNHKIKIIFSLQRSQQPEQEQELP